ncbi:MAG TPA: LytR C-terminal domain-containing protein [Gemmatimonadaceae bacterium]|nr:LytR C-terminal domain-containing protein [Gemmatimonadaceae bacterium]
MRRRGRIAIAAMVVLAATAGAAYLATRPASARGDAPASASWPAADTSLRAPAGVRIQVEVLNASTVRGLAHRATGYLRDLGYDVVGSGNARERHDSTVVLVRRDAGRAWAERVARAMGGARVEERLDSLRYLDVTVLVGGSWRPPPGPFRP